MTKCRGWPRYLAGKHGTRFFMASSVSFTASSTSSAGDATGNVSKRISTPAKRVMHSESSGVTHANERYRNSLVQKMSETTIHAPNIQPNLDDVDIDFDGMMNAVRARIDFECDALFGDIVLSIFRLFSIQSKNMMLTFATVISAIAAVSDYTFVPIIWYILLSYLRSNITNKHLYVCTHMFGEFLFMYVAVFWQAACVIFSVRPQWTAHDSWCLYFFVYYAVLFLRFHWNVHAVTTTAASKSHMSRIESAQYTVDSKSTQLEKELDEAPESDELELEPELEQFNAVPVSGDHDKQVNKKVEESPMWGEADADADETEEYEMKKKL